MFAAPGAGDFRLTPGSPCIDAGTDFFAWQGQVLVDLDPEDYCGPAPDQGALESCPDPTGVGDDRPPGRSLAARPNPFNPRTVLAFPVDRERKVKLSVHDPAGRLVAVLVDRVFGRGHHRVEWDGRDRDGRPASSGPYLVRLETGDRVESRKVLLVR